MGISPEYAKLAQYLSQQNPKAQIAGDFSKLRDYLSQPDEHPIEITPQSAVQSIPGAVADALAPDTFSPRLSPRSSLSPQSPDSALPPLSTIADMAARRAETIRRAKTGELTWNDDRSPDSALPPLSTIDDMAARRAETLRRVKTGTLGPSEGATASFVDDPGLRNYEARVKEQTGLAMDELAWNDDRIRNPEKIFYPPFDPTREAEIALAEQQSPAAAAQMAQSYFPLPEQVLEQKSQGEYRRMGKVGAVENLRRGMDTWQYKIPIFGGVVEAGDLANLYVRAKRLEADQYQGRLGQALRNQDIAVLVSFDEAERELAGRGQSFWAQSGSVIANSMPYMVEFGLSAGMLPGAKKAGQIAIRRIMQGQVKKGVSLALRWGAGASSKAATATITTQAGRTMAAAIERMRDKGIYLDEAWQYQPVEKGMSVPGAVAVSLLEGYLRNLSEQTGEAVLAPGVAMAGRGLRKYGLRPLANEAKKHSFSRIFVERLEDVWAATGKPRGRFARLLKKGGFDGIIEEMGEERVEDVLMATATSLFPGAQLGSWDQVIPTLEQIGVELVSFSVPGGLSRASNAAARAVAARREFADAGQAGIAAMSEAMQPPAVRGQTAQAEVQTGRPLNANEMDGVFTLLDRQDRDAEGKPIIRAGVGVWTVADVTPDGVLLTGETGRSARMTPDQLRQRLAQEQESVAGQIPLERDAAPFVGDTVAEEFVGTDARNFATESNDRGVLGFSPADLAQKDAQMLRNKDLIRLLDVPESGDLTAAQNRDFARAFVQAAQVGAEMLDRDGNPLPDLGPRMERAVLGSLFLGQEGSRDTVTFLVEQNRDNKTRKLASTLVGVSGRLLKLAQGKPHFDLLPSLGRALQEAVRAQNAVRNGEVKTEADFFRQGDFLTQATSEVREVAHLLLQEDADTVQEVLRRYTTSAESVDQQSGMLFSTKEIPEETLLTILKGVWENVRREQGRPSIESRAEAGRSETGPGQQQPGKSAPADPAASEGGEGRAAGEVAPAASSPAVPETQPPSSTAEKSSAVADSPAKPAAAPSRNPGSAYQIQPPLLFSVSIEDGETLDSALARQARDGGPQYSVPAGRVAESGLSREEGAGVSMGGQPGALHRSLALVQLAQGLLDGQMPQVRKKLRLMGETGLGVFHHSDSNSLREGEGSLALRADIFIGPILAEVEVKEKNGSKAETHLLERILAARSDLDQDRIVVRRTRAKRAGRVLLTARLRDHEYAAKILAHEIGHAYDWLDKKTLKRGNLRGHVAGLHHWLNRMLAETPPPESSITARDLKDLQNLARRMATADVHPKANPQGWKEARKRHYEKLKRDLMAARGVVDVAQVIDELKALTQWWNPFNEAQDPSYTAYRHNPKELTAEAISVLLNDAEELRLRAPTWFRLFENYLENRPIASNFLRQINEEISTGKTVQEYRKWLHGELRKGAAKRAEQLHEELSRGVDTLGQAIRRGISSRAASIATAERKAGNETANRPTRMIEEARYSGSFEHLYMQHVSDRVGKHLRAGRIPMEIFGEWLIALRESEGDRFDLANPGGARPTDAKASMDTIRQELGPKRMRELEAAVNAIQDIRQEIFFPEMERLGPWGEELLAKLRANRAYVPFKVNEYLDQRFGAGSGLRVMGQTGTLKGISDPFGELLAQDIRMLRAARWNAAKKSLADALASGDVAGEAMPAETAWDGRNIIYKKPTDRTQTLITYLDNGQMHGVYVPSVMAEAFARNSSGGNSYAPMLLGKVGAAQRWLMVGPFKFGYQVFNLLRDTQRTMFNAPGFFSPVMMPFFQAHAAWQVSAHKLGFRQDVIDAMLRNRELLTIQERHAAELTTEYANKLLAMHGSRPVFAEPGHRMARLGATLGDLVRIVPSVIEWTSKVAAHNYMHTFYPELGKAEIAHRVRTQFGSPDFLERGSISWLTNPIWVFSNAQIQGAKGDWEALTGKTDVSAGAIKGMLGRSVFWKYASYVALPAALNWSLKRGVLSQLVAKLIGADPDDDDPPEVVADIRRVEDAMQAVSEHDASIYGILPLATYEDGLTMYLRVPQTEGARFVWGGVFHTLDAMAGTGNAGNGMQKLLPLVQYSGDQVPGMAPVLEVGKSILWDWLITQRIPIDSRSNRPIMPENVWQAREEMPSLAIRETAKWTWGKLGMGTFWNLQPDWKREVPQAPEGTIARSLQNLDARPEAAMLNDMVSRFVRVSDYGREEALKNDLRPLQARQAADSVIRKELARRLAEGDLGEAISERELQVLRDPDSLPIIRRLAKEYRVRQGLPAESRVWLDASEKELRYLLSDEETRRLFLGGEPR